MTRRLGLDRLFLRTFRELVEDGTIDPSELERERIAAVVVAAMDDMAAATLVELRKTEQATLAEHREIRQGFEQRLFDLWGPAIDALEIVLIAASEAGDQVLKEDRRIAAHDPQFQALVGLHARACLVTSEILALLRSGHASGAHARWRTLHELAVVAMFIKEQDRSTAERYLVHADVRQVGRLDAFQKYADKLGEVKLSPAEEQAVRDRKAEILKRESDPKGFASPWGWAGPVLGISRPTFDQIEDSVKLDHWRPWVGLAHYPVHAGVGGAIFDMGNDADLLLAGPSNAGLADPGHSAAISLLLVTLALLLHRQNADRLLIAKVIQGLVDDVGEAFAAVEAEYDRRKSALTRHREPRRARRRAPKADK